MREMLREEYLIRKTRAPARGHLRHALFVRLLNTTWVRLAERSCRTKKSLLSIWRYWNARHVFDVVDVDVIENDGFGDVASNQGGGSRENAKATLLLAPDSSHRYLAFMHDSVELGMSIALRCHPLYEDGVCRAPERQPCDAWCQSRE